MSVKPEATQETRTITVAHSPDSDDAFMFYGLATNKLETEGIKFEHTLKDIQSLNEDAKNGVYDVTAISFHGDRSISTTLRSPPPAHFCRWERNSDNDICGISTTWARPTFDLIATCPKHTL